jgi:hypothetical protein
MSRSVKQDYDKMREREFKLIKLSATIQISDEALFAGLSYGFDSRYERKANKVITLPTSGDWGLYHQAVRGKLAMEAYEGTVWGGPDYGTEVHKPEPKVTYEWLETHDEWLARCRALRQETA